MPNYVDKIKVSGNWIIDYHYYRPVPYDYESNTPKNRSGLMDDNDSASNRAKGEIRDLIYCNLPGVYNEQNSNKFITLTFADNIDNFDIAVNEHKKFIQRLRYSQYFKGQYIRYLTVPEQQKRGAYHFHTVMFDIPYIQKANLGDIWGNGFVKINQIKDDEHLANYLNKYITKDFKNGLYNRKSYFPSRKLLRPKEEIIPEKISLLRARIVDISPNYQSPKLTQFDGYRPCEYKTYNLKDYPDILSTFIA